MFCDVNDSFVIELFNLLFDVVNGLLQVADSPFGHDPLIDDCIERPFLREELLVVLVIHGRKQSLELSSALELPFRLLHQLPLLLLGHTHSAERGTSLRKRLLERVRCDRSFVRNGGAGVSRSVQVVFIQIVCTVTSALLRDCGIPDLPLFQGHNSSHSEQICYEMSLDFLVEGTVAVHRWRQVDFE